jgi:dUTP pyrophosphatase
MNVTLPCTLLPGGTLPVYSSREASGCDVYAAVSAAILPGETRLIPVGIAVAIPEGYELQVRPRSGLSLHTSLRIANSPGTIDSDYRDEISIIVANTASILDWVSLVLEDPSLADRLGEEGRVASVADYLEARGIELPLGMPGASAPVYLDENGYPVGTLYIEKGDRIAQLVLAKVCRAEFNEVEDVRAIGHDRGGGFGSTGDK